MSDGRVPVRVQVNGAWQECQVEPRQHLVDFLRDELGLLGTRVGCEHGVCGACTVRVDGEIVRGCLVLAVQADGSRVETIEGLSSAGSLADLQQAFVVCNALQCGSCTSGMLLTADALLRQAPDCDRTAIREHLSGNYCRCTGYHAIVDAVEAVRDQRRVRASAVQLGDEKVAP